MADTVPSFSRAGWEQILGFEMARTSVTIVAAWIMCGGSILAAIIYVMFARQPYVDVTVHPELTMGHEKESLGGDAAIDEALTACENKDNNAAEKKNAKILSPLELTYSIVGLRNWGNEWTEGPISNGDYLYSGDCFKISFKTSEDCYIYVFLYGSGGIGQCLFPHIKIAADNRTKGRVLYTVPDGDNWYYLDTVLGIETIYIVACYERMNNIVGLLRKMEHADASERLTLSRDIRQEISDIQAGGLENEGFVFSQRGVSDIAPKPIWSLQHEGKTIKAVTEVVQGAGSVVKVISFEHR